MRLDHLPQRCYHQDSEGKLCLILKGQMGYFLPITSDQQEAEGMKLNGWNAYALNSMLGVSPEEEDVMVGGSMFGWNTPLVQDFINDREDEAQESLALSREMDHINGYQ